MSSFIINKVRKQKKTYKNGHDQIHGAGLNRSRGFTKLNLMFFYI